MFGPEYDVAVAHHKGDIKAAEGELGERVQRYGSLQQQQIRHEACKQYAAQWTGIQEQFVASQNKAVIQADAFDALLAGLARGRGFPGGERFEDHLAVLSVHYPGHIHDYRMMHSATHGRGSTEELREALVQVQGLFDALIALQPPERGRPPAHSSNSRRMRRPFGRRTAACVGLDATAWEELPTRLMVDDRVVHVACFPVGDDTVLITRGDRDHFSLLVVPPDTTPDAARAAMARAVNADNVTQAEQILIETGTNPAHGESSG